MGDRTGGPDRLGGDSAEGVLDWDALGRGRGESVRMAQGVIVAGGGLVEGDVLEVVAARMGVGHGTEMREDPDLEIVDGRGDFLDKRSKNSGKFVGEFIREKVFIVDGYHRLRPTPSRKIS